MLRILYIFLALAFVSTAATAQSSKSEETKTFTVDYGKGSKIKASPVTVTAQELGMEVDLGIHGTDNNLIKGYRQILTDRISFIDQNGKAVNPQGLFCWVQENTVTVENCFEPNVFLLTAIAYRLNALCKLQGGKRCSEVIIK